RLRRGNRQQSHTESGRYSELDQLRQSGAGRITHRKTGHDVSDQTVRLLGEIQIVIKISGERALACCKCASLLRTSQSSGLFRVKATLTRLRLRFHEASQMGEVLTWI